MKCAKQFFEICGDRLYHKGRTGVTQAFAKQINFIACFSIEISKVVFIALITLNELVPP